MIVSIDFETRSAVDLRKTGVYIYADDDSTDIWCMAYAFDDEEPKLWTPADPIDVRLEDYIVEGGKLRAWNANFERVIWNKIMVPRYKWPRTRSSQWHCTMAQASAMGLPRALGQAADVLGVEQQKDKTGQGLMLRMARPRKTKADGTHTWWNTPDKMQALFDYCLQDVRTEVSVAERLIEMDEQERQVFLLDQRVNDRGVMLDRDLLERVRVLADTSKEDIDAEIARLTKGQVTGATKGVDLVKWLNAYGISTKSVDKQHVTRMLDLPNLHPVIRKVLMLRQDGAKSSTAKLDSMESAAGADDRMRGLLVYHGAATGRWSGKLVQPQNFPRPSRSQDELNEIIAKLKGSQPVVDHGAGTLIASDLLRSMLIAKPGHRLLFADYAAIEARVLAWLAGETELVKTFAAGGDVYKVMAKDIYGKPVDKIDGNERQVGKMAILGCFGPDTDVLTNRGWVPITEVGIHDRLWDGEEWVTHYGVVPQGTKHVVWNHGVAATPDHEILTEHGWVEWQEAHTNPSLFQSATRRATLPSWTGAERTARTTPMCGAFAAGLGSLTGTITDQSARQGVDFALSEHLAAVLRSIVATPRLFPTTTTGSVFSTAYPRAYSGATTRKMRRMSTTGREVFSFTSRGAQIVESFYGISSPLMDGMCRILNWIARTVTKDMNRAISALFPEATTWPIGEKSRTLKQRLPTYDIAYVGPRNRYTIRTDRGPVIVHNCGYGMGGKRFAEQCKAMGIEVDGDEAKRIVYVYRESNSAISNYWRQLEDEFLENCREVISQKGSFARLPLKSGRCLTYHNPRIVERETPWGEKREAVEVDTLNSVTRQWTSQIIWGGLLTENVVQATARDLMAGAMMRLEMAGYPVIMSVHDEIICEVPDNHGTLAEMIDLMVEVPAWAKGCPIAAEGKEGPRYEK